VTLTLDTRARVLLLVLFVLATSVASLMAYRGLHGSSDDSSTPAPLTAPAPKAHASSAATATAAAAKPAARHGASAARSHAAPAAAAPAKVKPAATPPPNQLPAPIRRALAAHHVVVVALYDPNATIDGAALAEARAGAKLGGVSFVPIDVRSRAVDSLNARYGAVHDPSVLVLRPPDSVVVRIDGFADRDTVAQAALNASS
jgi:hypothetical protein